MVKELRIGKIFDFVDTKHRIQQEEEFARRSELSEESQVHCIAAELVGSLTEGKLDTYIILCQNFYANLGPKSARYIKELDEIENQILALHKKKNEEITKDGRGELTIEEVMPFATRIRDLFKGSPKFKLN